MRLELEISSVEVDVRQAGTHVYAIRRQEDLMDYIIMMTTTTTTRSRDTCK